MSYVKRICQKCGRVSWDYTLGGVRMAVEEERCPCEAKPDVEGEDEEEL